MCSSFKCGNEEVYGNTWNDNATNNWILKPNIEWENVLVKIWFCYCITNIHRANEMVPSKPHTGKNQKMSRSRWKFHYFRYFGRRYRCKGQKALSQKKINMLMRLCKIFSKTLDWLKFRKKYIYINNNNSTSLFIAIYVNSYVTCNFAI